MLRNTSAYRAITCAIVTRHVGLTHAQIHIGYPYFTWQATIGQIEHVFLLLHDSYPRPSRANPFVARPSTQDQLGQLPLPYPINRKRV